MKKLQLKLDGVKEMLTREQMKKVIGGTGSSSGSGSGKKGRMCCWYSDCSNCSSCEKDADSTWTCSAGFLCTC